MRRFVAALAAALLAVSWSLAVADEPRLTERERAAKIAEVRRELALLDSNAAQFRTFERSRQMRKQALDARPKPKFARRGEETGAAAERLNAGYVRRPGVGWVNPSVEAAKERRLAAQAANPQPRQAQSPSFYGYFPPYAYSPLPGPFYENISQYGNQTYVNGFGPYGPFNETVSQYGNQIYVNGFGVPPYGGFGPGY